MVQERETSGAAAGWLGWNFALATLVSAFLLFQVQPLVSKSILPWFGGSPAVWTTAMLFFQTTLFAGYVYAHLLQRWLSLRHQAAIHLLVVVAAVTALMLMQLPPGPSWKPIDSSNPTWRVLVLLLASVGLPYFALSASSPLIQAWFSRVCADRSAYRLYALSNAGSLVGLLSYPFIFEPAFDLTKQSAMWFWGFVVYGLLCAVAVVWLVRMRQPKFGAGDRTGETQLACSEEDWAAPNVLRRVLWLGLPAAASLMLLATTNHVFENIPGVPFLWVMPLTLYLLTFIICFDHQRWYVRELWAAAAVLALVIAAGNGDSYWFDYELSTAQELTLYFAAMFFSCMVCHGELVRLKPAPRHLTEFYLLISAGGAVGGIFVGLVAPNVFKTYFEWPIALVTSCSIAILALAVPAIRDLFRAGNTVPRQLATTGRMLLVQPALLALGFIIFWRGTGWEPALDRARNFYGVLSVLEYDEDDPKQHDRRLIHGAITHGQQYYDPVRSRWAASYYSAQTGVARTIRYFRTRGPVRVGVVGLGVGTLATYARKGDEYRFYEINPEVLRMAREHFTYLADCRTTPEIVMGDARLSLERELSPDGPSRGKLDVLVLDAFSGDSIPTHLLTKEAFEIYRQRMAPGGVIVVHITNRYLYLAPVVRGLAEHFGLETVRTKTLADRDWSLEYCDWMMVTDNQDFLQTMKPPAPPKRDKMDGKEEDEEEVEKAQDDFTVPLWTDKYNSLFRLLRR